MLVKLKSSRRMSSFLMQRIPYNPTMLSIALVHAPVYDRKGLIQSSSITPFDIHDLARSSKTYGIDTLYITHPSPLQRHVAMRILGFWEVGGGKDWNPCRSEALSLALVLPNIRLSIEHMKRKFGSKPRVIGTTAKIMDGQISYDSLRPKLSDPTLLIFGTGWGLAPEAMAYCDDILEPIWGPTEFNHLSVRSAVAIILDRLLGRR